MMAQTTIAPIKQAIVKALRADAALKAALNNEIHEAVAPRDVEYPYLVYDVVWARHDYRWGGDTLETGFDIVVVSDDQVEAHNLDQSVFTVLQDAALDLGSSGQTKLLCRRRSDSSTADIDRAGKKVYQVGGTYEIWTDQRL
jgi:hypothetical protein